MESRNSKLIADGRAWKVDGRAQALVGPRLAAPLITHSYIKFMQYIVVTDQVRLYVSRDLAKA